MGRLRAVWACAERVLRGPIKTAAPAVRGNERARVGRDGSRSHTGARRPGPSDKVFIKECSFPKELNTCENQSD